MVIPLWKEPILEIFLLVTLMSTVFSRVFTFLLRNHSFLTSNLALFPASKMFYMDCAQGGTAPILVGFFCAAATA